MPVCDPLFNGRREEVPSLSYFFPGFSCIAGVTLLLVCYCTNDCIKCLHSLQQANGEQARFFFNCC